MFKFSVFQRKSPIAARRVPANRPADPFANFTAHDWADLPPFHPAVDRDPAVR